MENEDEKRDSRRSFFLRRGSKTRVVASFGVSSAVARASRTLGMKEAPAGARKAGGMSLFTQKNAVETRKRGRSGRKGRKGKSSDSARQTTRRVCRVEELEKREYLAADLGADPISVGIVYAEQYQENLGDKFYVAWVGGEEGCTTLDSLVIDLDKNGNGRLDEGEPFFDTSSGGLGVYSSAPFTLLDKTDRIGYDYEVEDGGSTLRISFTNFYAGDHFVFSIDLDEYQSSLDPISRNAQVEGGEMGGSLRGIAGSRATATFSSDHYQTEVWPGMFVDDFDGEYHRSTALSENYDRSLLPYDLDDGREGIDQAGIYDEFDLTPKPIVVSGYVYADHDVDCNYDLGQDEPLPGVAVWLVDEDGARWTTTTDANGYYEFNSDDLMPGKYQIFSQSNVVSPEGLTYFDFCAKGGKFGVKISELEIDVDGMKGGEVAPDNNFAKALPATIEGYVFEDLNDANNKEPGENWDGLAYPAQVELWRVDRDAEGNVSYRLVETQTVDADGHYKFTFDGRFASENLRYLPERTYELREIFSSPDYTDGKDYVGTLGGVAGNDVFKEIFVGYGKHGYDYNFGELKLGSIAGNVWEDRNDNGAIDPGEGGIADVTIELYQWDGAKYVKIAEQQTKPDGSYLFDNLDICCEYAVREKQPEDYADGKDSLGTLGGEMENDYFSKIEVGWDEHGVDYNFGELKLGSIAGNVYEDRNDNGVFDVDEDGIGDVTVELYQWNGFEYVKIAEQQTKPDGSYIFENLDIAKEYAVREKQPEDYLDGKDSVGSLGGEIPHSDEIRSIMVGWDDHGIEYNFGELIPRASLSGFVYEDNNDNGVKEKGEAGIENVILRLYVVGEDGTATLVGTQITDADGYYLFSDLEPEKTYVVRETQPDEYYDGKDAVGTVFGVPVGALGDNDEIVDIALPRGGDGVHYDFGELKPGAISGYVYEDLNDNGIKDPGEAGIPNVVVSLSILNVEKGYYEPLDRVVQTDAAGHYVFDNLEPGRIYRVTETQPAKYKDGKDTVGSLGGEAGNDILFSIPVMPGDFGVDYNFGELIENGPPFIPEGHIPPKTIVPPNVWGPSPTNFPYIWYQPTIPGSMTTLYGGGGGVATPQNSWKLSVINGGTPRSQYGREEEIGYKAEDRASNLVYTSGENDVYEDGTWVLLDSDFRTEKTGITFGKTGAKPIVGDWDGDGIDNMGLFIDGSWTLRNDDNGEKVFFASLGGLLDTPVVGDWDGDGKADIGVYGPKWNHDDAAISVEPGLASDGNRRVTKTSNAKNLPINEKIFYNADGRVDAKYRRHLFGRGGVGARADVIDHIFEYGEVGGVPIVGDWNGDGVSEIGVYLNGEWALDTNGNGKLDQSDPRFKLGVGGDGLIPVVGDWNGNGVDSVGLFDPDSCVWSLDVNGDHLVDMEVSFGQKGDSPVVGDWNGDGVDQLGVYRPGATDQTQTTFGMNAPDIADGDAYAQR